MWRIRDALVFTALFSAAEAYAILHFAPQLKPTGGLGRLAEWCWIANTVLLFVYRWFIYPFFFSPLRGLPGPKGGNWLIGHGLAQFSLPRGATFLEWVNSIPNEGLIHFNGFFNRDMLIPTTHETLKSVLSDHSYDYEKPAPARNVLRRILGDGLIIVEGGVHKFQRKHLMPSFQLKHIRELYPMFWSKACEMIDDLAPSKTEKETNDPRGFELEFGEWTMRATLDIIGIAGFGRDFNSLKNPDDELVRDYTLVLEPDKEKLLWFGLNIVLPQWIIQSLPWYINKELTRIQKTLNSFALSMVKERRSLLAAGKTPDSQAAGKDILTLLVESNDFTDAELADQVLTMMAAGHETTSSALSWAAFLLSLNPELQARVRDEVRAALPSPANAATETVTAADVDALPWLNAVCLETTRLYPTVPITVREVVNETTLGGRVLPKQTTVILSPWAINRSTHFWGADAGEFRPERWLNDDGTVNKNGGSSSNYAQLTFLHGPRSCIGQGFAQSELKCLLAALVGRYEMQLSKDKSEYYPAGLITTKVAKGMWLRLKALDGW